jgi:hypothetical protein
MSTPVDVVPDVLVLAAVDRAVRHRGKGVSDVPVWAVLEHLDIARRSKGARHVRFRLEALEAAGSLERRRRHGVPVWGLSRSGRRRLRRAQAAGRVPVLPESPQHRAWREASAAAAERIDGFREQMRDVLGEAGELLDAGRASSDAWFELGERLARASWRMGSATFCLHEWVEPDDAQADVDDGCDPGDDELDPTHRRHLRSLRSGRRNTRRWDRVYRKEPPTR